MSNCKIKRISDLALVTKDDLALKELAGGSCLKWNESNTLQLFIKGFVPDSVRGEMAVSVKLLQSHENCSHHCVLDRTKFSLFSYFCFLLFLLI